MRRTKRPAGPLGDLQAAVLQLLWERDATLSEIVTGLALTHPVAKTTVATVLARLEQSGFVTPSSGNRGRVYSAVVPRVQVQRQHARTLIDRLFGGRAADLVAHLIREADIDEADLTRLRTEIRRRKER